MKIAILQARMGSERLPGKVLKKIAGRPMLSRMLDRVRMASSIDKIIVATSDSALDDPIEKLCEQEGIGLYRGSEKDVLARYFEAATLFNASVIVRLTGDCPLIDPRYIDRAVALFDEQAVDYMANTVPPPGTFPDGMDVEVFSFEALRRAHQEATLPSEREHVTFFMWKTGLFRTGHFNLDTDCSCYRLTVDYPEDFEGVCHIYEGIGGAKPNFSLQDIIWFIEKKMPAGSMRNVSLRNKGWQKALDEDETFLCGKP